MGLSGRMGLLYPIYPPQASAGPPFDSLLQQFSPLLQAEKISVRYLDDFFLVLRGMIVVYAHRYEAAGS